MVAVFKATYDINTDGTLSLAQEQVPINFKEQFYGELNHSSMCAESDIAPYKPQTDIIIHASAFAPKGEPARSWEVEVVIKKPDTQVQISLPSPPQPLNPMMAVNPDQIRRWEQDIALIKHNHRNQPGEIIAKKTLKIVGPRYWKRRWLPRRLLQLALAIVTLGIVRLSDWYKTTAKSILEVPIRYEHAWGGSVRHAINAEEEIYLSTSKNPIGKGYFPSVKDIRKEYNLGRLKARSRWNRLFKLSGKKIPLPLIEHPGHPVEKFGKNYPVEGLGIVTKAWDARTQYAGTYDAHWENEKAPLLPDDFDFKFWNGAHPDLQVPYLEGNEHISMRHIKLEGALANLKQDEFSLQLPGENLNLILEDAEGKLFRQKPKLDTVVVDMHASKVFLMWRAAIRGDAPITAAELELERKMA